MRRTVAVLRRRFARVAMSLLLLSVFSFAGIARADYVEVTCPGQSLNAAVGSLSPHGPHHIVVEGTCPESIYIEGKDFLTITGPTAIIESPGGTTFQIVASRRVVLDGLTIRSGGAGITLDEASVEVRNCLVDEPQAEGITAKNGSMLRLVSSTVSRAGGPGVALWGDEAWAHIVGSSSKPTYIEGSSGDGIHLNGSSTVTVLGNTFVEGNEGFGINQLAHSRALIIGGTAWPDWGPSHLVVIRDNEKGGLQVAESSHCALGAAAVVRDNGPVGVLVQLGGVLITFPLAFADSGGPIATLIEGHARSGVEAKSNSQVTIQGLSRVLANGTPGIPGSSGVSVTGGSHLLVAPSKLGDEFPAEFSDNNGSGISADFNSTVQVTGAIISNNTDEGVRVELMSLADLRGDNTYFGNGRASVSCDDSSMVVVTKKGDIPKLQCKAVKKASGVPESPF